MPLMYAILKGLILTLIVLVTIIGNVLVCLSVILVRKLRKPQNYLLVSLAVSDLFVALIVMPFAMVFELNEATWPLSDGLCDLWVSGELITFIRILEFVVFISSVFMIIAVTALLMI